MLINLNYIIKTINLQSWIYKIKYNSHRINMVIKIKTINIILSNFRREIINKEINNKLFHLPIIHIDKFNNLQ